MTKETLIQLLFKCIEAYNEQRLSGEQLVPSVETILFGRNGKLDSLGLINFIVMVEEKISDELGIAVTIADERAMAQKHSPFRTVETLAEYIDTLLRENHNA